MKTEKANAGTAERKEGPSGTAEAKVEPAANKAGAEKAAGANAGPAANKAGANAGTAGPKEAAGPTKAEGAKEGANAGAAGKANAGNAKAGAKEAPTKGANAGTAERKEGPRRPPPPQVPQGHVKATPANIAARKTEEKKTLEEIKELSLINKNTFRNEFIKRSNAYSVKNPGSKEIISGLRSALVKALGPGGT